MDKEKIKFSKEIVKSFDLFLAVIIGVFASFVLYAADASGFLGSWGLDARLLGFLRNTLVYGILAAFLCMGVVFLLNSTKKSVTILDYLLIIIEVFGLSSLVIELILGANTQVFDWYVWLIVSVLGIVLLLLRQKFVCEECEIPFGDKRYFAAVSYRYNLPVLAVFGLLLGIIFGVLGSSMGLNTILNNFLPALGELANSAKYGIIIGGFGAAIVTIWLVTILNNLRTKVNFGDALLVTAQIALFGFSVYFAPKMPAFKPNFLILYVGVIFVLILTTLLRGLFINTEVVVKKSKPSPRAYYYEVTKTYAISLLTAIGVGLAYLIIHLDIVGLAHMFSGANLVTTIIAIVLTVVCGVGAIITLAKGQLVSKKVEFIDALLYIAVSGGVASIVVIFTAFNILKVVIWALLFVGILCFVAVRCFHVVPELTTVAEEVKEEVKEEVIEEKKEEVIDTPVVEENNENEDEEGLFIKSRYKKSFLAKLTLADDEDYDLYNALKNHILTYKVKSRISWNYETFNAGRNKLVKLNVRGKTLVMYIALDAAKYENTKYNLRDASDSKKFEDTPSMLKIKSSRGLKYAIELVDILMAELGIKKVNNPQEQDYRPERKSFEELLAIGLIKDLEGENVAYKPQKEEKEEQVEEVVSNEVIVETNEDEDEENGFAKARYKKSFLAKLTLCDDEDYDFYNAIKNHLLSYKVKARLSWNYESVNAGRKKLAKINVRGKTLVLYLALKPAKYENTKYHFRDASESKKFAETPMMLKIRSSRGVKHAIELIDAMMAELGLLRREVAEENYRPERKTFDELLAIGLIKDLLAEENNEVVENEVEPEIVVEQNDEFIKSRYKRSYFSRLALADDALLDNYNTIKNALVSYKNKARISWSLESFNVGRKKTAKINVRGKSLVVYLALDPIKYENSKYHFKNVSDSKRFAETPMMIKVRSSRSVKYALELIADMMAELGLAKREVEAQDFRPERKTFDELIAEGYIKDKEAK